MNFTFSVAPETIDPQQLQKISKSNGLFRTLQLGYSRHIPIAIRPDDVMNTVGCIWAKYIVLNSERFRSFFVNHEGKKVLEYKSGGTYSRERLPEFMNGLIELVKKDQDNDNLSWMDLDATTTTDTDRFVRCAATLASQKEYYEYRVTLECGFSLVKLLGTKHDWDMLEQRIQSMATPDDALKAWQERLLKTITGMRSGDESFWQRCLVGERGSGSVYYYGWILDFNPIDEKGSWMSTIEDEDILDLTVDFEIKVDDNGRKFKVNVEAGTTGVNLVDNTLQPANTFSVQESGQEALVLS